MIIRLMSHFITYQQHKIAYTLFGSGRQYIFAFHGVLLQKEAFSFMQHLDGDYTVIAVDLPFHGATVWQKNHVNNEDVVAIFQRFIEQLNITSCHLFGYSIGARLVHILLEAFPSIINSVVYAAPDGVTTNKFYKFATSSVIGKPIFKLMTHRVKTLHRAINMGVQFKMIPPKNAKFIKTATGSAEKSMSIYKIWNGYAYLQYNIPHVIQVLTEHQISVLMVLGKYDEIIRKQDVAPFIQDIPHLQLVELSQTHHLLTPEIIPTLQTFYDGLS